MDEAGPWIWFLEKSGKLGACIFVSSCRKIRLGRLSTEFKQAGKFFPPCSLSAPGMGHYYRVK